MSDRRTVADVVEDIEYEGFDYALIHYSNYDDVHDDKFQELYQQFKKARIALSEYLRVDA